MASRVAAAPGKNDLIPRIPYPILALFLPIPEGLRGGMRTIDPIALPYDERGIPALEMLRRSVSVVREIERAAQDRADPKTKESCLAFPEAENELTGAIGLLVSRRFADGSYSRPLAELLTSDCDSPQSRSVGNLLGRTAEEGKLVLVAYQQPDDGPQRAVFACIEQESNDETIARVLLARLLVTPFEIAQWPDPMVEEAKRILH